MDTQNKQSLNKYSKLDKLYYCANIISTSHDDDDSVMKRNLSISNNKSDIAFHNKSNFFVENDLKLIQKKPLNNYNLHSNNSRAKKQISNSFSSNFSSTKFLNLSSSDKNNTFYKLFGSNSTLSDPTYTLTKESNYIYCDDNFNPMSAPYSPNDAHQTKSASKVSQCKKTWKELFLLAVIKGSDLNKSNLPYFNQENDAQVNNNGYDKVFNNFFFSTNDANNVTTDRNNDINYTTHINVPKTKINKLKQENANLHCLEHNFNINLIIDDIQTDLQNCNLQEKKHSDKCPSIISNATTAVGADSFDDNSISGSDIFRPINIAKQETRLHPVVSQLFQNAYKYETISALTQVQHLPTAKFANPIYMRSPEPAEIPLPLELLLSKK